MVRKIIMNSRQVFKSFRQLFYSNINRKTSTLVSPKFRAEQPSSHPSNDFRLIQQIRQEFMTYGSGSVDLVTDNVSGVAVIRLSNPNRKNSLSGKMMAVFTDVLSHLENWQEGKAVILIGSDNFFCSGGDLNTVRQIDDSDGGRRMSILMQHNYTRLQSLPLVSVAVVEGMAIGGGAEMLTACDYRLATRDAKIGFVHIRVGITLAWGGGSRLTQLVGPQKALDLMLTGRTVKSDEALDIGLIEGIIENNENALEESREWLKKYIKYPAELIRAAKGIVNGARYLPLELSLRDEIDYSSSLWGGLAHKKALADNVKHK